MKVTDKVQGVVCLVVALYLIADTSYNYLENSKIKFLEIFFIILCLGYTEVV